MAVADTPRFFMTTPAQQRSAQRVAAFNTATKDTWDAGRNLGERFLSEVTAYSPAQYGASVLMLPEAIVNTFEFFKMVFTLRSYLRETKAKFFESLERHEVSVETAQAWLDAEAQRRHDFSEQRRNEIAADPTTPDHTIEQVRAIVGVAALAHARLWHRPEPDADPVRLYDLSDEEQTGLENAITLAHDRFDGRANEIFGLDIDTAFEDGTPLQTGENFRLVALTFIEAVHGLKINEGKLVIQSLQTAPIALGVFARQAGVNLPPRDLWASERMADFAEEARRADIPEFAGMNHFHAAEGFLAAEREQLIAAEAVTLSALAPPAGPDFG